MKTQKQIRSLVHKAKSLLDSWLRSLENPEEYQHRVLNSLIQAYSKTGYGERHKAEEVDGIEAFRNAFPIMDYQRLLPYLREILSGNYRALLSEPPIFFGATSGTTGKPKLIPITKSEMERRMEIILKGAMQYASFWKDPEILGSPCLTLHLPSRVREIKCGGMQIPCGYVSGLQAEYFHKALGLGESPLLKGINALGPGVKPEDWSRRFSLVYEFFKEADVRWAVGSPIPLYLFARWLRRRLGVWPKDVWNFHVLFCGGVPHIHERHEGSLKRMYGWDARIVEMYGATEGLYAMQMDDKPYITPFYDVYLYEVVVGGKVKMLHEMEAGEKGSLVVSSQILPRYRIGDLIKCYTPIRHFKVLGRDDVATRLGLLAKGLIQGFVSLF